MDGTFVDSLAAHVREPQVLKVHGIDVLLVPDGSGNFRVQDREEPIKEPATVKIASLSGLVDYVRLNRDSLNLAECIIHVSSATSVSLLGKVQGRHAQRVTHLTASCENVFGQTFAFGEYVDQERFVVALQSLFEAADQRDAILDLVSGIKDGTVATFEDDGRRQAVTAANGVHIVKTTAVPNPVTLRPFRTFREIEQPSSLFVLRLKSGPSSPLLALYEADGGKWRLEAMHSAAKYLRDNLGEAVPVIV